MPAFIFKSAKNFGLGALILVGIAVLGYLAFLLIAKFRAGSKTRQLKKKTEELVESSNKLIPQLADEFRIEEAKVRNTIEIARLVANEMDTHKGASAWELANNSLWGNIDGMVVARLLNRLVNEAEADCCAIVYKVLITDGRDLKADIDRWLSSEAISSIVLYDYL